MALSARDISEIEKAFPAGLSSKQIFEVLDKHGERLTEATLRKYVQLGLLPRSRRVGEKGKHRGSRGIYPVDVIRRVDEIRRAMTEGETLEEIACASTAVRARLSLVRVSMDEALDAAEKDLASQELERKKRSQLKSGLGALRKDAKSWLRAMEKWTGEIQQAQRSNSKSKQTSNPPPATKTVRKKKRAKKRSRRGGV